MAISTSKRMKQAKGLVEQSKSYKLEEAVSILKKAPQPKFNQSVELAVKLNLDMKENPQPVRGTVVLPHGTGRAVKVAVFCKENHAQAAKEAGADIVGAEDLIKKVSEGFMDFDVAVAMPDMMKDLAKLGKILGPRGLMPSPKAGTVTDDVAAAVSQTKKGKVEFKMDKGACINMAVGKVAFEEIAICENARVLIQAIKHNKPAHVKGQFIKSVSMSTTMGPGVRLDPQEYR
ncbi:MAG: 50S ribosomal protein L1 [Candidatus Omnitrophica bacterium]|nr:50S ribosomal protein L1 [Candidatus Omnitrophota bacterium]